MSKIDVGKLISEIEKRPALWDMRTVEYSDRVHRKQSWEEICVLFEKEGMIATEKKELEAMLHKKWKNIRDNFSRDLLGRKRKSGSEGSVMKAPYMYSQQLQFLRDTISLRDTNNSLQGSLEQKPDSEHTSSSSNPTPAQTPFPKIGRKRLHPVEERIIRSSHRLDKNREETSENDDNRHFLLSLLPSITSLPKILNSKCRLEIMQVVNRYEEYALAQKNQEMPTCSSAVYQPVGLFCMMPPPCHLPQSMQPHIVGQGTPLLNTNQFNFHQPEVPISPVDSLTSDESRYPEESQ